MQLQQPDEDSCRSEILHARVYGLDLSKGIARAEIFFAGLKKIASEPMVVEHWWLTLYGAAEAQMVEVTDVSSEY